ncbi:MAG: hypothetical protein E7330_01385 [Clostridiales bacterium]|nr:hypothetical protein [Clostridiales bacterium]
MKLHGMLLCALLSALLLFTAACGDGDVSPTPTAKPNNTVTPSPTAAATPDTAPSPTANMGANTTDDPGILEGAADTIEGFVEGAVVEIAELPEKVSAAIKDKYPDATVKGATYATYMNGQMYKLTLDGAKDGTTDVYARADGTLVPYTPDATPGGSNGGSGSGGTGSGSSGSAGSN